MVFCCSVALYFILLGWYKSNCSFTLLNFAIWVWNTFLNKCGYVTHHVSVHFLLYVFLLMTYYLLCILYLFYFFFFLIFIFTLLCFTILYWFCHTLTWISHGCTWVPNPEPLSHLPPHIISLDQSPLHDVMRRPSTLGLDWLRFKSWPFHLSSGGN